MIKKINFILIIVFLISYQNFAQTSKYTFETARMGSPFRIVVSTNDSAGISKVIQSSFEIAWVLESQLSDYQINSELSQVNLRAGTGEFFPIHSSLKEILIVAMQAENLTQGALNVKLGRLVQAWRKTRKDKILPDEKELRKIALAIQGKCVEFSNDSTHLRLADRACQLDLGSLGKGFVAQKVLDHLVQNAWPYALVDAGGKICMTSLDKIGGEWSVGLEIPGGTAISDQMLKLKNCSIASSGKTYQQVQIGDQVYSHVLDPRTGMALMHGRSATAIAADGTLADWLATAATVMTLQEIKKLLVKLPDVRLLVWEINAGKMDILLNHNLL
jgi:thiamine biosynthesis lipoprotein